MAQSIINTNVLPFKATAYHNGEFVEVTEQDTLGKWVAFVFYPADFTFVCPTELGDLAEHYAKLQEMTLMEKQKDFISTWVNNKINSTYVSIHEKYKNCSFDNQWLQTPN